jgi:hypothetical protein
MSTTHPPEQREKKMTWKNLVNPLAITSRRRLVASAILYGLSLSIRFTSATGEEVEIPPQSAARAQPIFSSLKEDVQRPWGPKFARPIFFRHGWPPSGACRAGCESATPASLMSTCPAP